MSPPDLQQAIHTAVVDPNTPSGQAEILRTAAGFYPLQTVVADAMVAGADALEQLPRRPVGYRTEDGKVYRPEDIELVYETDGVTRMGGELYGGQDPGALSPPEPVSGRAMQDVQEALAIATRRLHETEEQLHAAQAENQQLREHILDIDAHATPYGDLPDDPDDPGYVGTYLVTAGAIHRAIGKIGHTAPSCKAEAELQAAQAEVQRLQRKLEIVIGGYESAQQDEVEARTLLLDIRTQLYRFFAEESDAALNQQAALGQVDQP